VRHDGFSQAAKVVFSTQPMVSKAVKRLEGELGPLLLFATEPIFPLKARR
jgi:DNA-binding transcriptional LysR family regulator